MVFWGLILSVLSNDFVLGNANVLLNILSSLKMALWSFKWYSGGLMEGCIWF
jgi:hypothetical protein